LSISIKCVYIFQIISNEVVENALKFRHSHFISYAFFFFFFIIIITIIFSITSFDQVYGAGKGMLTYQKKLTIYLRLYCKRRANFASSPASNFVRIFGVPLEFIAFDI
jgi:hypothetical protein